MADGKAGLDICSVTVPAQRSFRFGAHSRYSAALGTTAGSNPSLAAPGVRQVIG